MTLHAFALTELIRKREEAEKQLGTLKAQISSTVVELYRAVPEILKFRIANHAPLSSLALGKSLQFKLTFGPRMMEGRRDMAEARQMSSDLKLAWRDQVEVEIGMPNMEEGFIPLTFTLAERR